MRHHVGSGGEPLSPRTGALWCSAASHTGGGDAGRCLSGVSRASAEGRRFICGLTGRELGSPAGSGVSRPAAGLSRGGGGERLEPCLAARAPRSGGFAGPGSRGRRRRAAAAGRVGCTMALAEVVVCAVGRVVTLPAVEITAQATALLVLVMIGYRGRQ